GRSASRKSDPISRPLLHGTQSVPAWVPTQSVGTRVKDEMKVPLSWLRDYVDVRLPVAQLAERLTLAGLEVAGGRVLGLPVPEGLRVKSEDAGPVWDRDKVILARVLQVEKHPNADRLTLVTLDYGASQPKTVVTGAPNLKVGDQGQRVILGLAGTTY